MKYDPAKIESKWQKKWASSKIYASKASTSDDSTLRKYYILDMFPYPSGEGLHVGHPKGYIATDVISRMKRMQGLNVLHPMGFDAFGLPAENYALKTKTDPAVAVNKNVARFKKQLEIIGLDYDWSREVNTTDPEYYRWTQWIFLQLFKKGLVYESYEPVNWCPTDKTVLANEDVENGRCERCGTPIEKKPMRQWVLKITDYADRLLNDLDAVDTLGKPILDWPQSIKEAQRNWIGRSEGALLKFEIRNTKSEGSTKRHIEVFTTRPDTLFGVTYVVLAPEHKLVRELLDSVSNKAEVEAYISNVTRETEIERTDTSKEKTGIELKGVKVINPANNEEVPVWIADYVLADYGTGAVMAVPAHDERDWDFAEKFGLKIARVIKGGERDQSAYIGDGVLIDSGSFTGKESSSVMKEITDSVGGKWVTKYKLRDWVFSRQRYWGEPIPLIRCEKHGVMPVPEKDLPVKLPKVKSYEPTGTGESPLAAISKWVNIKCPVCKGPAKRETNTMPQWAGSCWYYLRYMDPRNRTKLVDPQKEKYWSPVDLYVGGAEHATRHLIYARFWHKFLYDIGAVSTVEPFAKLQSVGLIMGEDGRKMSKRFGNVVNPDDVIKVYGADTLRLYEMFMGPFDQAIPWSTDSIVGVRRFIEKVWRLRDKVSEDEAPSGAFGGRRGREAGAEPAGSDAGLRGASSSETLRLLSKTIKKVTEDIQAMRFNTAISTLMIAVNELEKLETIERTQYESILKLLAPFAPHVSEEIWMSFGNKQSIHTSQWPIYDPASVVDEEVIIMVQVNGKLRGSFKSPKDASRENLESKVRELPEVKKWIEGKEVKKIITVPGRLVNIVV